MSANDDLCPVLVCRIEIPDEMIDGVDAWMPKHFDDSLAHPAVSAAASYRVLRDYSGALPALLNGHGNRFIVYVARDVPGLLAWLDSPELRGAIEDGVDREGRYPVLDDEGQLTGNVYSTEKVAIGGCSDFAGGGPILAQRFEVPEPESASFDEWMTTEHLPELGAVAGAVRVRSWCQVLDVPRRFPFDRYVSKGNRMVLVEFAPGADPLTLVGSADVRAALGDSARWDLRLPYVRRELCENLVVRTCSELVGAA